MHSDFDWLLVGGGLQNALIALAVKERWPQARIAIVERERALGGSHLWCFHAADLPVECAPFVGPLVAHRWESYEVHFPSYQRRFELPYAAISSARLDAVVRSRLADGGSAVFLGTEAEAVGAREVRLADGRTLTAKAVVDARGPSQLDGLRVAGYQKFVGLEIELGRAHGIERPILMDATVPQLDGFRFVYALPIDRKSVV